MSVNASDAIAAYGRVARLDSIPGLPARDGQAVGDFASVLRETAEAAVETLHRGEIETLKAAAGKADLNDVITAMTKAEVTLQTVVAIRDRVIQAYQEILRMPI